VVHPVALTLRSLTAEEVTFELLMDQDDVPFEGNVMASGNTEVDDEAEKWVESQLADGNSWAWCIVTVTARYRSFAGIDSLCGCSYESEETFKACDYYKDLCSSALENLNSNIAEHFADLKDLLQGK
jgi:hypothetical protein